MESVLSTGRLDSSQDATDFLVTMENTIKLLGPQLTHNHTKLDTTETGTCAESHRGAPPQILLTGFTGFTVSNMSHNQVEIEIRVQRGKTPPTGPVHLTTQNATVVTDWATAAGTGVSPGKPAFPSSGLQLCSASNIRLHFPL